MISIAKKVASIKCQVLLQNNYQGRNTPPSNQQQNQFKLLQINKSLTQWEFPLSNQKQEHGQWLRFIV